MSYPSCKSATYLRLISNQDRVGKPPPKNRMKQLKLERKFK